jgi:hypothetical protein
MGLDTAESEKQSLGNKPKVSGRFTYGTVSSNHKLRGSKVE